MPMIQSIINQDQETGHLNLGGIDGLGVLQDLKRPLQSTQTVHIVQVGMSSFLMKTQSLWNIREK